jgi:hypothetical protein
MRAKLLVFLPWILSLGCAMIRSPVSSRTGILVPLYIYPGPRWDPLVEARKAHPSVPLVAIVNPDDGPGSARDPRYTEKIRELRTAGVTVIGYVATGYARKAEEAVRAEVERWGALYSVDGIFFDEMVEAPGCEAYYRNLGQYAKSKGLWMTVGNPGTEIAESYAGCLDAIVLYENAGLPNLSLLGGWHAKYGRQQWAILPYGVSALDPSFVWEASKRVGLLYVTDQAFPDPWNALPGYFLSLVAALDRV